MEFLSLSRRRSSARNVPSGEQRGETDVFAGYNWDWLCLEFYLEFSPTVSTSRKEPWYNKGDITDFPWQAATRRKRQTKENFVDMTDYKRRRKK